MTRCVPDRFEILTRVGFVAPGRASDANWDGWFRCVGIPGGAKINSEDADQDGDKNGRGSALGEALGGLLQRSLVDLAGRWRAGDGAISRIR